MATYNKFEDFVRALGEKEHDLNDDTFKAYLSNAAPSASADVDKTDVAEITNENGYTAPVDIQNAYTETGGVGTMTAVDITITASGGTVGPFQYVIIYNDDHASDGLLSWVEYPTAITLQDGEEFVIDFSAVSLFTIT